MQLENAQWVLLYCGTSPPHSYELLHMLIWTCHFRDSLNPCVKNWEPFLKITMWHQTFFFSFFCFIISAHNDLFIRFSRPCSVWHADQDTTIVVKLSATRNTNSTTTFSTSISSITVSAVRAVVTHRHVSPQFVSQSQNCQTCLKTFSTNTPTFLLPLPETTTRSSSSSSSVEAEAETEACLRQAAAEKQRRLPGPARKYNAGWLHPGYVDVLTHARRKQRKRGCCVDKQSLFYCWL